GAVEDRAAGKDPGRRDVVDDHELAGRRRVRAVFVREIDGDRVSVRAVGVRVRLDGQAGGAGEGVVGAVAPVDGVRADRVPAGVGDGAEGQGVDRALQDAADAGQADRRRDVVDRDGLAADVEEGAVLVGGVHGDRTGGRAVGVDVGAGDVVRRPEHL